MHALDSSQELEFDILKKEMKQMKIAPFKEIIEQQKKVVEADPDQFKSLQSFVNLDDFKTHQYKELFQ